MFRISFEHFGDPAGDEKNFEFTLDPAGKLTTRELIEIAVAKESQQRKAKSADLPKRQKEAIAAFERGTFAMLADGRQVSELDAIWESDADLCFIRIIPLVGG